jgi:hypothetical protein
MLNFTVVTTIKLMLPSIGINADWCFSYQSLSRYTDLDYDSYRLLEMEFWLTADMTGRQGMCTPSRHLIPPLVYPGVGGDHVTGRQGMCTLSRHLIPRLVYPEVRVCPISLICIPCWSYQMTVRYLFHFIQTLIIKFMVCNKQITRIAIDW